MTVATAPAMLLVNGSVVDCVGGDVITDTAVLVHEGRITAIGPERRGDRPKDVIDLEGGYLIPGLWDSHCHLSLMIPDPTNHSRFDSEGEATIRAGHNAMAALHAGFTALRVTGEVNGIDTAWRTAFKSGMFDGPRIFSAGHLLGSTAGHLRQHRLAPQHLEQLTDTFDGPDEALKVVRRQILQGADLVKVAITGGMGPHEGIAEPHLEVDELAAVVRAAHGRGRRVAAHASGGAITKEGLRLGIDSIEHGYALDEECIDLMVAGGAAFVPTIGVTHDPEFGRRHQWAEAMIAKASSAAPAHHSALNMAIERGVRICSGGDKYPIYDSGVREIELLAELGVGNLGALQAATINGAWLSGVDADVGTVDIGKIADLVVLRANPLDDISALREITAVIKGGRVVRDDRTGGGVAGREFGRGVNSVGVPLPPEPPDPEPRLCC